MTAPDLTTIAFYDTNARQYSDSTVSLDLRQLYEPFLKELAPGAHILDAGAGSGRDTKAFLEQGYCVTAIDASSQLAQLATGFTGQRCEVLSFQEIEFREEFDGIWACASLLHVPKREMNDVLCRFIKALKPGGVFYMSIKEGEGERLAEDGRFFSSYTTNSFRELLANFSALREIAFWKTQESRSVAHPEPWLSFLLAKTRAMVSAA